MLFTNKFRVLSDPDPQHWHFVTGLQVRELRLKEESGVEEDYGLDQAEMNYLEQEVKRITGEHSYL